MCLLVLLITTMTMNFDGRCNMKKKMLYVTIGIIAMLLLMIAEYQYIMQNIYPYKGDNDTLYLEVFGQVNEYYMED